MGVRLWTGTGRRGTASSRRASGVIRTAAGTFFLCCVVTAGTLTAVAVGSGTAGADVPSVNWTHLSSASSQPTRNAAVMEHEPAIRCALANGRIAFTGPNTCVLDANYIAAKQFQQLITVDAQCPPGYYSATGSTPCTPADPGSFVAGAGATSETECAAGTYQPDSGQSSCLLADPGSFVATIGATSETECAAGTYQPDSGQSSCLLADPGSFVAAAGATAEFPCSTGTFSASAGATSCTLAPPGTYVNTTGAAAATDCALGTYQPDSGQTSCIPAPPNTYVDTEGATSPTPCPAGTFNPDSGSTSVAACVMVTVTNPGDQSDYVNAPITALTNSQTNGIGPVSWSATGLPAGLTIDPSSGTVTGTPTTPCTCSVTLKATDVDGNVGTAAFTWTVLPFGIVTTSLPTATPNVPYGPVTLQAAGLGVSASPYTTKLKWKEVTLPEGMTLSLSGVLSGTPNKHLAAGPSSITVRATETVITLNGTKKVKTKTTVQATIPLTIT